MLQTYDKHSECRLDLLFSGVGPVTKNDLELAKTFGGIVYTLHVGLSPDLKGVDTDVKIKDFKVRQVWSSLFGFSPNERLQCEIDLSIVRR